MFESLWLYFGVILTSVAWARSLVGDNNGEARYNLPLIFKG